MAEIREVFPNLELPSGAGQPARAMAIGSDPAGEYGGIGFAFKDASGLVTLPQLDSFGRMPVTFEAISNGKYARGEVAAGSGTLVTIASLALTVDKVYEGVKVLASCFRDAVFQVIISDDGAETVVGDIRVGPGQFTFNLDLGEFEFTAGSTGAQLLLVKAYNTGATSALTATVSCREVA